MNHIKRYFVFPVILVFTCSASLLAQSDVIITAKAASIRLKPSDQAKIVGTVKQGTKLKVIEYANVNDWVEIKQGPTAKGWVRKNTLRFPNRFTVKENPDWVNSPPAPPGQPDGKSSRADLTKWIAEAEEEFATTGIMPKSADLDAKDGWKGFDWEWIENLKYYKIIKSNPKYIIRRIDTIEFWLKETNTVGKAYMLKQYRGNCSQQTISLVQIISYAANGVAFDIDEYPLDLHSVVPESRGELWLNSVCRPPAPAVPAK